MKRKNRKYSREFRIDAVRLSEEEARSIAEIARFLGIEPKKLAKWHARFGHEGEEGYPGNVILGLEEEVRCLRVENRHLRVECAQMKKAMAFTSAALRSEHGADGG